MKIIDLPIDELIPYENNPRNNAPAVKAVAESIKQFGFKVPSWENATGNKAVRISGQTK